MNQWFQYPHKPFSKLFANIRIQFYVYSKTKIISGLIGACVCGVPVLSWLQIKLLTLNLIQIGR